MKYSLSMLQQSSLPHETTVSSALAKSKDKEQIRFHEKPKLFIVKPTAYMTINPIHIKIKTKPTVTEWNICDLFHVSINPILFVAAAVAFSVF